MDHYAAYYDRYIAGPDIDDTTEGDCRRCPVHGVATSSPDGLHDAPCNMCEAVIDGDDAPDSEATQRADFEMEHEAERRLERDF